MCKKNGHDFKTVTIPLLCLETLDFMVSGTQDWDFLVFEIFFDFAQNCPFQAKNCQKTVKNSEKS